VRVPVARTERPRYDDTEAVNLLGIWFTPPEILLGDAAGSSGVRKILHRAARNGQSRWRELLVARYQSGSGNRGRMLWREVPHAFSNRISQARIAGRPDRTGLVDHVLEVLELVKRTIPTNSDKPPEEIFGVMKAALLAHFRQT